MKRWAGAVLALTVTMWLSGVGAAAEAATTDAAEPAEAPAETEEASLVLLPLAEVEPIPIPECSLDDLARMFPAFEHAPYESSGFNHLTLPFLYLQRMAGKGNPEEALAFSFLLSNDIDWAPGNYCTRHAYFTFKRARRYMEDLAQRYNPKTIRMAIEDWEATHAVGGTLIRSAGGYSANLLIYDADGRVVLRKRFAEPRDYFDLLGDVSVEVVRFLSKSQPLPALVEHLHRQRCDHHESIVDLGRAAFIGEKSPQEWQLYERILGRDPGFADVRYWYANQRQWQTGDWDWYAAQMEQAIDAYVVAEAVFSFEPEKQADPRTAERKNALYLEKVTPLVGAEFPDLLREKLRTAHKETNISPGLLERATRVAHGFPNEYWLLYHLAKVYCRGSDFPADDDLAVSLIASALRSRFLPSIDHRHAVNQMARALQHLGRYDLCVRHLYPVGVAVHKKEGADESYWLYDPVARSLHRMGHHAEAVKVFNAELAGMDRTHESYSEVLVLRGIAAAHAGNLSILKATIDDQRERLEKDGVLPLLQAYRDLLEGKPVDGQEVVKRIRGCGYWADDEAHILAGQADLVAGTQRSRDSTKYCLRLDSQNRAFCVLYDLYQRTEPSPDNACFYEMLDWLHSHDPWARQAVADFRKRAREKNLPAAWPPEKVADLLKDFGTERYPVATGNLKARAKEVFNTLPPGTVAAALRTLVQQKRFDEAEDLALRHHYMAVEYASYYRRTHANHLIHLVQQARREAETATDKEAPTDKPQPGTADVATGRSPPRKRIFPRTDWRIE